MGSTGCQPVAFGSLPNAWPQVECVKAAGPRQAAADYRPAACAPQRRRAHAIENFLVLLGSMQVRPQLTRRADHVSGVLPRLAIRRGCAIQSDRGRTVS